MKKVIGLLLTVSISITMAGDNRKLDRVQKFTPSNHDHWIQMTKAARTGELPKFLKESKKLNRENVRMSGRVEESKRQLNRAISDSDLIGRWEETSSSEQFTLTVGSDQEIPNPLHVFGLEESEGAITIEDNTGAIEATYLPTGFAPIVTNYNEDIGENEPDFPILQFSYIYMGNMEDYVSHPDSIFVAVFHDSVSYSFGTAGGELMDNVTIFAGDVLYDEDPEWGMPMVRIVHGITIKDTIPMEVIDLMENTSTVTVTGEIEHGRIPLMAGIQYPIEDPFGLLWDEDEEYDDYYIEKFYIEFLSDNTGRFIDYWEDLEYNESYIDSFAFVWSTWDDTLAITQKHTDWDEDKEEEIVITETFDVVYKVENTNLSISQEFDFCEDGFEDPLSPYACGDSLRFLGLFGLKDVESLIISFAVNHDYDGETGTRTDLVFNLIMPGDGSLIEITSDNAWTDSLVFAWESADHLFGDGDVTYYSELSGDLDNFFLVTSNTTDNIWKIPYHHIKDYMDQAGISKATGMWDIKASGNIPSGSSLKFDGDGDYISFGDDDALDFSRTDVSGFSYSVWLNTSNNAFQQILCKRGTGGAYEMQIDPWEGGTVTADYLRSATRVDDGKWHNIIVTYDFNSSLAIMYVDGIQDDVGSIESDYSASSDGPLHIGADSYQGEYFDGFIKEVAIWVDALDPSEVPDIYNSGRGVDLSTNSDLGGDNGIRGYWPLNAGVGNVVIDVPSTRSTDPVVNGTIYGAQWTTENSIPNWYNNHIGSVDYSIMSSNGPIELTIDASGLAVADEGILPNKFALHSNFPNPFNPTTSIMYDLPENVDVSLMIYDIMGREIRHLVNKSQNAGFKAIMWDGNNNYGHQVGTGMYLYQIKAGSFVQTRKMLLMK